MIKIRYSELPAGLYVRVKTHGRSTIVYLRPGLTLAQRRAALLRVRRSASLGYGPRLPAAGLAAAVARDRIRATLRNGTSAFRAHPILLLPMVVVLSATMVYVMSAAVTVTIHSPRSGSMPGLTMGQGSNQRERDPAAYPHDAKGPGGSAPSPARSPAPTRSPRPTPGTSTPAPTTYSRRPPPAQARHHRGRRHHRPRHPRRPWSSGTCVRLGPLGICLHR